MVRFCPLCGKSDSQAEFFGELCLACAKGRLPEFAPVRVAVCGKCGSLIDRGRKRKAASLEEEVIRLLKLKGKDAVFHADTSEMEYQSDYGRVKQNVLVLTGKSMCTDCSRAGSQYFEAIIQLRGNPGKISKMADLLLRRIEEKSFVPKIEELKEGLDIYCGGRNEAIAALNTYELGFLRTEKLAGEKDGKRLYRTTLLVRL